MQARRLSMIEAASNVVAVEAERKLVETPAILKMPSGYIQQNPWLTIAIKQMELVQRFAAELGMTPSSKPRRDHPTLLEQVPTTC